MAYMALNYDTYVLGTEKILPFLIVKAPFLFGHFIYRRTN
jgi:hypothetical protein